MDDLHQMDVWQRGAEVLVRALGQGITELDGRHAATLLLLDNGSGFLLAGQEDGGDALGNFCGDRGDLFLWNDAWPAWHRRDQPECSRAVSNRQRGLLKALDATYFDPDHSQ